MKPKNIADWIYERLVCIVAVMFCFGFYIAFPFYLSDARKELKKQNTTLLKRAGSMIFGIDIN